MGKFRKIIVCMIIIILSYHTTINADKIFTFELGTVTSNSIYNIHKAGFDPSEVSQLGFMLKKEKVFLHFIWGSLIDIAEIRTAYIFGEIGYEASLFKTPFYWGGTFGIGRVDQTSKNLSSKNMYTESLFVGYKNYYLSLRHMSNGGNSLGNPGPNSGRNTLNIGFRF